MHLTDTATDRFDFFMRREGKQFDVDAVYSISLDLPAGTTLADAMIAAWSKGMSKGSHRSGCFEVQCGAGIYRHDAEKAIRLDALDRVTFRSWEQMEADELAEMLADQLAG